MEDISGILKRIDFITGNIKLRNYIENCIKLNNGKLYIDLRKFNQCDIAFKNTNNESVYINVVGDHIYVYITNIYGNEELVYNKKSDGIDIQFNSFRRFFDVENLQVIRITEENTCYDNCGMLVSHNCHVNEGTYINGEVCETLMYANYDRLINDYLVGDELVRFENFDYHYHPELNRELCYVSDYQHGMFCSGDASKIIKPRFMPFIGDFSEYKTKIEKNNSKTLKI